MNNIAILGQLVLIIGVSLAAVVVLRRFRVPSIVSFMLVGIIIGPGGLYLVKDPRLIEAMADIGVIFLLFTIGLNFSLAELSRMRTFVFLAGGSQVILTIVAVAFIVLGMFGLSMPEAFFWGFLIAMTSTTIMSRILEDRGESQTLYGRMGISISIFQDLAVIPMMVLVPLLGSGDSFSWEGASLVLVKSVVLIVLIIFAARYLIPWLLERVVRSRSREVFTLTTVVVALGTAYLAGIAGFSLALGAFLAGVVVSESNYSHQILSEIAPLKDAFSGLFFISIGMLVDPRLWIAHPFSTFGLAFGVIALKASIVGLITILFGFGIRIGILAGLAIAQIGEFSFILAQAGAPYGLLNDTTYQMLLSLSVFTMALSPFIMTIAPMLAGKSQKISFLKGITPGIGGFKIFKGIRESVSESTQIAGQPLSNHVIIVGYGINGRNVSEVLRVMDVRYFILELNVDTVHELDAMGESVGYGDASREDVLINSGVLTGRAIVISIADPPTARQIVALARRLNPKIVIIVRTRFMAEIDELYALGADEVIPEEFETSLELADAVMTTFGVGEPAIEKAKAAMRAQRYGLLRRQREANLPKVSLREALPEPELAHITLLSDYSGTGKKLAELNVQGQTGASVIAVSREGKTIGNPPDDFVLRGGDTIYLFGRAPELESARRILV